MRYANAGVEDIGLVIKIGLHGSCGGEELALCDIFLQLKVREFED